MRASFGGSPFRLVQRQRGLADRDGSGTAVPSGAARRFSLPRDLSCATARRPPPGRRSRPSSCLRADVQEIREVAEEMYENHIQLQQKLFRWNRLDRQNKFKRKRTTSG